MVGAACLLLRPASRSSRLFGLFLVFFGLRFLARNLTARVEGSAPTGYIIATVAVVLAILFLLAFLRPEGAALDPTSRRHLDAVAWASLACWVAGTVLLVPHRDEYRDFLGVANDAAVPAIIENQALALLIDLFGMWFILAALRSCTSPALRHEGLLLAALCFTVYGAYDFGSYPIGLTKTTAVGGTGYFLSEAGVFLAPIVVLAQRRPRAAALARRAASLVLATVTVAFVLGGLLEWWKYGDIGVVRILALGLLVHAILRRDLLEVPLRKITVRTGVLAAVALAGLFVTAQIAQNFLSATYGLYIGGVVAGIAVFAAFPLQRAAERALERRDGRTQASAGEHYRRQVEIAWTDGRLGPNERLMLAEARRQLGLDAEHASTIDEEVARTHLDRRAHRAKGRQS